MCAETEVSGIYTNKMATPQLDTDATKVKAAALINLSNNTRVIVHASTPRKTPYLTFIGERTGQQGTKAIHISKTAYGVLSSSVKNMKEYLKSGTYKRIDLSKRQWVEVTCNNDTYYVQITQLKPRSTSEQDHQKTVKLLADEIEILENNLQKIDTVMYQEKFTPMSSVKETETSEINVFKWKTIQQGIVDEVSYSVFLNEEQCKNSLLDTMDYATKTLNRVDLTGDVFSYVIPRPNRMAVVEYVTYKLILSLVVEVSIQSCHGCQMQLGNQEGHTDGCLAPPSDKCFSDAFQRFDKDRLLHQMHEIFLHLSYKEPYSVRELYDTFVYYGGLPKIRNMITCGCRPIDEEYHSLIDNLMKDA